MAKTDYLILGSGLAAMSFAALMAKAGKKVTILEAHYCLGGYGHTFVAGDVYRFNAQFHYVWNCAEGHVVHNFLKKLNLHQEVTFEKYDHNGYDHNRMPGYALDIPSDLQILIARLQTLFSTHAVAIETFIHEVEQIANALDTFPMPLSPKYLLSNLSSSYHLFKYRNATLQQVFDQFQLPLPVQTLLALQWEDFLLPPRDLSFFAWVTLFIGYCRGAYYPTKHFEHVINTLAKTIEDNGGEIIYNRKVIQFIRDGKTITGVVAEDLNDGQFDEYHGQDIICNIDPKKAAEMIGFNHFSNSIQRKLMYDYSPSNFMAYCVVKDLDLRDYGFGRWNIFHTEQEDLNQVFDDMYLRGDYSKPSFVMTTPSLLTHENDCPENFQIIEFLTVANYDRFHDLKIGDAAQYRKKKKEIFDAMIAVVEKHYIPEFSNHLVFKMTGSPTTNQRFCGSPAGNSYGSNLTAKNLSLNRLDYRTSLKHFYFCNASSGFPGFSGTIKTGSLLYEHLTGDLFVEGDNKT